MHDFDYLQPNSVEEASALLAEHGENARIIAGGTALTLGLRQRMLKLSHLISVQGIARLHGLQFDPQYGLRIGALNRHNELARSALVRQHAPMLAQMAHQVANPQVRNQGTIGGNLCYGDPSTDPPSCLLALNAYVVLGSSRGERILALNEFLLDYFVNAMQADELLLEIIIPPLPAGVRSHYQRFLRTAAEHRPLVNVAAVADVQQGVCRGIRLAIGAAVAVTTRASKAEALLLGQAPSPELVAQAAACAAQEITPITDQRGSAEYRRAMVQVTVQRNLQHLFELTDSAKEAA